MAFDCQNGLYDCNFPLAFDSIQLVQTPQCGLTLTNQQALIALGFILNWVWVGSSRIQIDAKHDLILASWTLPSFAGLLLGLKASLTIQLYCRGTGSAFHKAYKPNISAFGIMPWCFHCSYEMRLPKTCFGKCKLLFWILVSLEGILKS